MQMFVLSSAIINLMTPIPAKNKLINYLFIIIALFLVYSLLKTIFDYRSKFQFAESYKKAFEAEKQKNSKLKSDIVKSRDLYQVERNLREDLNMAKPGEIVVIVPKITPIPSPSPTPIVPNYQQW